LALIGLKNEFKTGLKEIINQCQGDIKIRMLSGDPDDVCKKVAENAGINRQYVEKTLDTECQDYTYCM